MAKPLPLTSQRDRRTTLPTPLGGWVGAVERDHTARLECASRVTKICCVFLVHVVPLLPFIPADLRFLLERAWGDHVRVQATRVCTLFVQCAQRVVSRYHATHA